MNCFMRKAMFIFIMSVLAVLGSRCCYAQNMTTMGTDFWFTFLNTGSYYGLDDTLKVFVSGQSSGAVTLTNPNTGWSVTEDVLPGSVTTIPIPSQQCYMYSSGNEESKGIHLTATDPVSVYISTTTIYSYDIANVFPTSVLRDKYMLQSYPDSSGSEFVVVATEDSTWVDIVIGAGVPYFIYGDTISVLLPSAGDCYMQERPGNFTGTRVFARDCKRVAVFNGVDCLYVPDQTTGQSCDHVMEQAVPVEYWGRKFVVVPSMSQVRDRVRVTALKNYCNVKVNYVACAYLMAGQSYEFEMPFPLTLHPERYIETSTDAAVSLYFSSTGLTGHGDPSMVTVFPVEQMVGEITFASYSTLATNDHYVNLVVRTEDKHLIYCDGQLIPDSLFTACLINNDYSFARLSLGHASQSHELNMDGGSGFNAYAYGLGNHESYGFSVGAQMKPLNSRLFVGGNLVLDGESFNSCRYKSVNARLELAESQSVALWYIGDDYIGTGDTMQFVFDSVGRYCVRAVVAADSTACYPSSDTVFCYFNVREADTLVCDSVTCDGFLTWYSDTLTSTGTYWHRCVSPNSCDTVIEMHLQVGQNTTYVNYVEGCDSVRIGSSVSYSDSLLMSESFVGTLGCDSIIETWAKVHSSYSLFDDKRIMEGDTLLWIDGNLYWEPTNQAFVSLSSIDGCDSIIRLRLEVFPDTTPPPIDSSSIWIPNAFTPDKGDNNVFKVFGNDIISMKVYIFTRTGAFVTSFDGLTEEWDGTYHGKNCPQAAYVYLVEYVTKYMPEYTHRRTGTVLLLR